MHTLERFVTQSLATAALLLMATQACAASGAAPTHTPAFATYPTKPECVAPAKPGGGFDLTCRLAAAALEDQLPVPMQVTFLPGGIGAAAYQLFTSQRATDNNALVAHSSGSLLNIATGKFGSLGGDDVRFVASAGADYGAVVVANASKLNNLQDLMAKLRGKASRVVFGGGGSVGSQDWVKAALVMRAAGGSPKGMRYVSFDGGGEALASLDNGNIEVYTGDVSELRAHLRSGKFRVLAVLSEARLDGALADLPTAKEQGVDVTWASFRGFYMGKHVDPQAYRFYVNAFNSAYASSQFALLRADKGLSEFSLSGQAYHDYVLAQIKQLRDLVRQAGLLTPGQ
ncbi:MAG: tripartite tricarboxylate transporter substrate-binding protein [Burkholderiaceae bacterium]|nr:tripartite tricarboxylate transporter substrate-binding protein [Burkholderiaceae bacterium]